MNLTNDYLNPGENGDHLGLGLQTKITRKYTVLLEQERLRQKLVETSVHDLNNQLNVIGLAADFCLSTLSQPNPANSQDAMLKALKCSLASARKAAKLTRDLLDISRLQERKFPLKIALLDLVALASESAELIGPPVFTERIEKMFPERCMVCCDRDVISRVLFNLLGNAAKFSPAGGTITLTVEPRETCVRVAVTDQGPGITPEQRCLLFEEFSQTSEGAAKGGTGLGLYFCKLAIAAHGGRIGVQSAPGHGSTFWFTLPMRQFPESSTLGPEH